MTKLKLATSVLDQIIANLARQTDQKVLSTWAADCAEHVLSYFEAKYPADLRPHQAIEACREWVRTGDVMMDVARSASIASIAAAREVADGHESASAAAYAAGQAASTSSVYIHSLTAARYAATAVSHPADPAQMKDAVAAEHEWQFLHLIELVRNVQPYIVPSPSCFRILPYDPRVTTEWRFKLPIDWDDFINQLKVIFPISFIETGSSWGSKYLSLINFENQQSPQWILALTELDGIFDVSFRPKRLAKEMVLWYRRYIPLTIPLFVRVFPFRAVIELKADLTLDDIEKLYPFPVADD